MLRGNQFQKELVRTGLAEPRKPRQKRSQKQYKCHKCGASMVCVPETNVMSCSNDKCNGFYVFNKTA